MFIPGFYPELLSDLELLNKTHELSAKLVFVSNNNGNTQLIYQIQTMLSMIENVRRERLFQETLRKNVISSTIESDKVPEIISSEDSDENLPKKSVSKNIMRRSTTPNKE